jgi:hypothetical protein
VAQQASSDQIRFTPEEHDVRVVADGWVYYVRGIRRGELFLGGGLTLEGGLVVAVIALVAGGPLLRWHERQPWKVGVVRFRAGGGGLIRTVHKERLPPDERPERRIAELVEDVKRGRFKPMS